MLIQTCHMHIMIMNELLTCLYDPIAMLTLSYRLQKQNQVVTSADGRPIESTEELNSMISTQHVDVPLIGPFLESYV